MASKLINDLRNVPDIIAALGIGIAEAQRRANLDYLQSLERLAVLAQSMLGDSKAAKDTNAAVPLDPNTDVKAREDQRAGIIGLITTLAPARYQYTETTMSVKLDLAQSFSAAGSLGVAAGVGAVAVNASLTIGFSYDYRAAAECSTVIHAVPIDGAVLQKLLDRAAVAKGDALQLPPDSQVDKDIREQSGKVFEKMTGFLPAPVKDAPAPK